MNLSATIVDFISGDSSRKKVVLRREAPAKVSGVTGYRGCPRTEVSEVFLNKPLLFGPGLPAHRGQPDLSRYACEIATVGSNAPTCVHGASDGIGPESPNGFHFTYYVVAITADGDSFPAKVFVSP